MRFNFHFLCALLACALLVKSDEPVAKQLSGPPEDFGLYRVQPKELLRVEGSSFVPYDFDEGVLKVIDLMIDSSVYFQFSAASACKTQVDLRLFDSHNVSMSLEHGVAEQMMVGDNSYESVEMHTFAFHQPIQGTWQLFAEQSEDEDCDIVVGLNNFNDNEIYLHYSWSDSEFSSGKELGLLSKVTGPSHSVIDKVQFTVVHPNGLKTQVQTFAGKHDLTEDGTWAGTFTPKHVGDHIFSITVFGQTSTGILFQRAVTESFRVTTPLPRFTGSAVATQHDRTNSRITFSLEVDRFCAKKYRAYAEVYATSSSGELIPVAWMSSLVRTSLQSQTTAFVPLELDLRWLRQADVSSPFVLKQVSLQSLESISSVSMESIKVSITPPVQSILSSRYYSQLETPAEATEEMRMGIRPSQIRLPSAFNATSTTPVILSHGYCAGSNPWEQQATSWNNPYYFRDFGQNRLTDEFAMVMYQFAQQQGIADRWVGIGHSQGGNALVHLFNYYWSGLDSATGRRIQSLGSPYAGTNIAGNLALLGSIFGIGCGKNNDLTRSGASAWAAGIVTETRRNTFYYTTTYKLGTFFGDYCLLAANTVLAWSNDGTTELDYAHLSGANNMGNTEQQCHTGGMKYIPQYEDGNRNHILNANAY